MTVSEITARTAESDLSSSINTAEILSSNDILQAALRLSTILKYKTYQTNWNSCCMQNNISHISELLDYFTHLYDLGASYNVLNSSKSALSYCIFATIFIYFRAPADYKIFQRCL